MMMTMLPAHLRQEDRMGEAEEAGSGVAGKHDRITCSASRVALENRAGRDVESQVLGKRSPSGTHMGQTTVLYYTRNINQ